MKKIGHVAIAALLLAVSACDKKPAAVGAADAAISGLGGDITVNGQKGIAIGRKIAFGDSIETGEKSFCEITVNEKNIFRIGAGSKLTYKISTDSNLIEVERGWFAGVTRKIFTKQLEYLIKTPTVTAGVRGTSYCAKVESANKTYFCVCNGTIELKDDPGKPGEKVAAAHHAARRFTRDKSGKIATDKNPGLLYHDDKGLEALAKKIGESVDWTKVDEK